MRAFDPEGRPRGVQNQRARLSLAPTGGDVQVELLTRMDLKPGTYQLRLAAHDAANNKSGSVYADVDVPDFGKAAVSLSSVLVSSSSAPPVAPRDALATLVPVVPTVEPHVQRVRSRRRVPARLPERRREEARVAGAVRAPHHRHGCDADREPVAGARAGAIRQSCRRCELRTALASLKPGPYLLTIEATLGKTTARRDVRFEIR